MLYFKSFCVILAGFLFLTIPYGCSKPVQNVKLYLVNPKISKPNTQVFLNEEPAFILNRREIRYVKLVQYEADRFSIELRLEREAVDILSRITYANVGKRLAFVSNSQLLFSPLIVEPIQMDRVVVELVSVTKEKAEDIARHFSHNFEFYDQRALHLTKEDAELKRAYEFKDKGEYDKAIEAFEGLVKKSKDPARRAAIYNEIALCYRLKGNSNEAAEAYRKLVNEPVVLGLDNYMVIAQAYFYLWKVINGTTGEEYLNKAISSLEHITKDFPTTRSAESANLTIGTYELLRNNVKEAHRRANIAKAGELRPQGYLLAGISYEYEKIYQAAKDEYKSLIEEFPNSDESGIANEFVRNLDRNKANIGEFLGLLE